MATATMPMQTANNTCAPKLSYTVLTKRGPMVRAKLPAAVNHPIIVPCECRVEGGRSEAGDERGGEGKGRRKE